MNGLDTELARGTACGIRRGKSARIVAILGIACMVAASCSSSGSHTGTSNTSKAGTSGTTTPLGSPVKLLAITTLNSSLSNHPEIQAAAQAAANHINASGGINGHRVNIIVCNDQGTATGAAACGQEAVSQNVLAVTGSDSVYGDNLDPILEAAHIPSIGPDVAAATDLKSPVVFPFEVSSIMLFQAMVFALADKGITRIATVSIPGKGAATITQAIPATVSAAKTPDGKPLTYVGDVSIPLTASDSAPYAASLNQKGAQGALLITSGQAGAAVVVAAKQAGYNITFAEPVVNFGASLLQGMGSAANGMISIGYFPDGVTSTNNAGIREFQKEMKAAAAAGVANAGNPADDWTPDAVDTWMAVYAVQKVSAGIQGPLTSQSLLSALGSAKDVDLFGIIPPWTPGQRGPADAPNISNPTVYFFQVNNAQNVLTRNSAFNVVTALNGGTR